MNRIFKKWAKYAEGTVNHHCLVSHYAVTSIHQNCEISIDKTLFNYRVL